jgi:hypothetical protein
MLQTAPVLLVFPPTIGPFAKVEGEPLRFDFTGYVSGFHVPRIFQLTCLISTAQSQPTRSIPGSNVNYLMARSPRLFDLLTTCAL